MEEGYLNLAKYNSAKKLLHKSQPILSLSDKWLLRVVLINTNTNINININTLRKNLLGSKRKAINIYFALTLTVTVH